MKAFAKIILLVAALLAATIVAFTPPTNAAARQASPLAEQLNRAAAVRRQIEAQDEQVKAMLAAEERHLTELQRIAPLVPPQYREMVLEAARANGLDAKDLAAVGYVETRWDCTVRGKAGEIGCLQVLPDTAALVAKQIGLTHYDLADPSTNVAVGAAYLRILRNAEGSMDRALASYNGGDNATERKPISARTYVSRVRAAQGMKGQ